MELPIDGRPSRSSGRGNACRRHALLSAQAGSASRSGVRIKALPRPSSASWRFLAAADLIIQGRPSARGGWVSPTLARAVAVSVEDLVDQPTKPVTHSPAPNLQLEPITRLPKAQHRFVTQMTALCAPPHRAREQPMEAVSAELRVEINLRRPSRRYAAGPWNADSANGALKMPS